MNCQNLRARAHNALYKNKSATLGVFSFFNKLFNQLVKEPAHLHLPTLSYHVVCVISRIQIINFNWQNKCDYPII